MEGRILAGKYRLVRALAEGGSGIVYEAEHLALGSRIVVKMPHPGVRLTPEGIERFRREAQAAAQLHSPHVVTVFDRGEEEGGLLWIAMEWLHGETLRARLARDGRLAPAETVELLAPLCRALHEAHLLGIVHRDLKPENIMLVPSQGGVTPKVFDFGIAAFERDLHRTDASLVAGTPPYMAPEQCEGLARTDARSDIYSLGVVAYQCLSGRLPHEAGSQLAMMNAKLFKAPRDLDDAGALPASLVVEVMRALDRDPSRRHQSALAMADALERALAEPAARPKAVPPPESVPRAAAAPARATRKLSWVWLVIVVVALVALLSSDTPTPYPIPVPCTPARYMPLEVGLWWRYRVSDPDTGRSDPNDKTIVLDRYGDIGSAHPGVSAFRLFRSDENGSAIRWLSDTGSGAAWVLDEWIDPGGQTARTRVYHPHRLRIDESCEHTRRGATWTERYDTVTEDRAKGSPKREHFEETWTVEAVDEAVQVPAGKFSCLRVRRLAPAAHVDSTYWFALGIGKIMEESPPKEHEELVAWGRGGRPEAGR